MTKITIKATLEEMDRLDYIGLFDVESAGVLYEQIEITPLDEGDEQNLELVLNDIRAKIAAKIGGNGSENDGLDKALAIIDEYIREGQK